MTIDLSIIFTLNFQLCLLWTMLSGLWRCDTFQYNRMELMRSRGGCIKNVIRTFFTISIAVKNQANATAIGIDIYREKKTTHLQTV